MTGQIQTALAFLGALAAGAVAVPVNTRFTDAEAGFVADDCGASLVIGPGDQLPDGPPHDYALSHADAVVGVPVDALGRKVGAVVPLAGPTVTPAELVAFARGVLADFKIPQYISVRPDPLPRNAGGKVIKPRLDDETPWARPSGWAAGISRHPASFRISGFTILGARAGTAR
jgi:acyl-CoA synthetase (AMP-forming)/AMP-acid ligase II